jgi:hypothetical protein
LPLLLVIVVTFKVIPLQVNAIGTVFLLLLKAPLEQTFWNYLQDSQLLFLNVRDILETTPI